MMTLKQAFYYAEHPTALERDFEASDLPDVTARMDRLLGDARREKSLAWQAFRARRDRLPRAGTVDAARIIQTALAAGVRPPDPPLRPSPDERLETLATVVRLSDWRTERAQPN